MTEREKELLEGLREAATAAAALDQLLWGLLHRRKAKPSGVIRDQELTSPYGDNNHPLKATPTAVATEQTDGTETQITSLR